MIKKVFLLFLVVFCSCLVSGCANTKLVDEYTLNSDLSVEHSLSVLVDNDISAYSDEIEQEFHNAGYSNIVDVSDIHYSGKKRN